MYAKRINCKHLLLTRTNSTKLRYRRDEILKVGYFIIQYICQQNTFQEMIADLRQHMNCE